MMPVKAILAHREQMQVALAVLIYAGAAATVATANPVHKEEDGRLYIMPGDPLTRENLEELTAALNGTVGLQRSVLPANVLVAEAGLVAWWTPIQRRPIFFETRTAFDAKSNARDALHPPLLFVGRPDGLTVYALPSNERPGPHTRLMRAPYYNLYGHGAMCRGTAPLPNVALASRIGEYEAAFFDSSFVHTNLGSADLTSHPQGHNGFWLEMIACTHLHFPFRWLLPLDQGGAPMTLQMAVNL